MTESFDGSGLAAIALNDLSRYSEAVEVGVERAFARVVASGRFSMGGELSAFESEFAAHVGVSHCVGVANGTDALEIALRALAVSADDEVITAANAGGYATSAILAIGAKPIFADVDPQTLLLSPASIAAVLSDRTSAVVVTHLYGCAASMPGLLRVTDQANVPVVEDCAQAHGATLLGKCVGSWGKLGTFSFYPTKNLGAFGDAGAVTTDDAALAARMAQLRQYGWRQRYESVTAGGRNSRMDEIQAAILRTKLPLLVGWNETRRRIAALYRDALRGSSLVLLGDDTPSNVAHLCVVRSAHRDQLAAHLSQRAIASGVHFPTPDYRQPAVVAAIGVTEPLKATEQAALEVLSVPCFPAMTDSEVDRVAGALRDWARHCDDL